MCECYSFKQLKGSNMNTHTQAICFGFIQNCTHCLIVLHTHTNQLHKSASKQCMDEIEWHAHMHMHTECHRQSHI